MTLNIEKSIIAVFSAFVSAAILAAGAVAPAADYAGSLVI